MNEGIERTGDEGRFEMALHRFDEENARDPNFDLIEGMPQPRELVYAQRLFDCVLRLCPQASEVLRLAARCQHLCRWTIPRSAYEMNRTGYLRWRTEAKAFHARKASGILREVGYGEEIISRVEALNLKKNFPADAEGRVLEDALCLMFLQYQFADLARRTSEEKMVNAVQKTWRKMTPQAQEEARKLPYGPFEAGLLQRALGNDPA